MGGEGGVNPIGQPDRFIPVFFFERFPYSLCRLLQERSTSRPPAAILIVTLWEQHVALSSPARNAHEAFKSVGHQWTLPCEWHLGFGDVRPVEMLRSVLTANTVDVGKRITGIRTCARILESWNGSNCSPFHTGGYQTHLTGIPKKHTLC